MATQKKMAAKETEISELNDLIAKDAKKIKLLKDALIEGERDRLTQAAFIGRAQTSISSLNKETSALSIKLSAEAYKTSALQQQIDQAHHLFDALNGCHTKTMRSVDVDGNESYIPLSLSARIAYYIDSNNSGF